MIGKRVMNKQSGAIGRIEKRWPHVSFPLLEKTESEWYVVLFEDFGGSIWDKSDFVEISENASEEQIKALRSLIQERK